MISRYHGGAFVVFSNKLNPSLEVSALEDTYASVIGGAPAAAVVFARDVKKRTSADDRIIELQQRLEGSARSSERMALLDRLAKMKSVVHSEKLREVAEEFDTVHSVHRALEVGSVHRIVAAKALRPYLIEAIQRGIARELSEAMTVLWSLSRADLLPAGDDWLGPDERAVQAKLRFAKRRSEWRLGRLAAKRLLTDLVGVQAFDRIQIIAAEDGAPEAIVDGYPLEISLSISHRDGIAAAAISRQGRVGCDLEAIERRTSAFRRRLFHGR